MDENKIDFLYPSSSTVSPQNSFTPPVSISHELGLNSFNTPQVTPISQIYPSRKIKHSFRKRASSGSMPYYIPFRKMHRQRTKSESQDNNQGLSNQPLATMEYENTMDIQYTASQLLVNNNNPQYNKIKAVQLKKSKSLESLNTKKDNKDVQKEHNFSTMEFFDLNHRIQKLNLVHHD